MHDEKMRKRLDRVTISFAAHGFFEISTNVRDETIRITLRLQGTAHLIIGIRCRSSDLVQGFVHQENGAVAPATQIEVVKNAGCPWIASAEVEGVPRHAVLIDRHA